MSIPDDNPLFIMAAVCYTLRHMDFLNCNLNAALLQGIEDAGYVTCTPVQEQVLAAGLDGSDLYVQSQTGTGKTAAYLVTLMQRMLTAGTERAALILVPTRELAVQVEQEACLLARRTGLKAASFYGGVGYQKQEETLQNGVNIIIGTPGRVIDLEKSKTMRLSNVGFLIVDEADRMFDMGFYPDLRTLLSVLPPAEQRQTMLFSATLNTWVKNLAWEYTIDAKEVTINADSMTVNEIRQQLFHVSGDRKMSLLLGILKEENPENTIIFCNTKKTAEIVAKRLRKNGHAAEFLIGDLPQPKRLLIIDAFKAGKTACLVATDVAARGIDINDLAMVINYDLPNEAENYVHRIGRTARAGKTGSAYSLCAEQDVYSLPEIEKYIEMKIPAIVPAESDFRPDKSEGLYIRLDRDKDEQRHADRGAKRGRKSEYGTKPVREGKRVRSAGKPLKSAKNGGRPEVKNKGKTEAPLTGLTFEERMAYYKNQYGKNLIVQGGDGSAETVPATQKGGVAGAHTGKKKNRKGKNAEYRRKSEKQPLPQTAEKRKQSHVRPPVEKARHPAQSAAQPARGEKQGLFGLLKKLFSKKNG